MRIPELSSLFSLAGVEAKRYPSRLAREVAREVRATDRVELSTSQTEVRRKLAQVLAEAKSSKLLAHLRAEMERELSVDAERLAEQMLNSGVFDDLIRGR